MSRLHRLTNTSSHRNKNITSRNTDDTLMMTKEDHHRQTDQLIDDWTNCLKGLQSTSHEEIMKTAKQFIQVDIYAKRTYQALEKTSRTLDLLLDRKLTMLSNVSTLTEIQTNLGLEQLATSHWVKSSP